MLKSELESIEKEIDYKLDRLEWLDENNYFENMEIIKLKKETQELIDYLRGQTEPKLRVVRCLR